MKIFFDTEFTGLHRHTTLISIGLVAENGRDFYAELNDYDAEQVDDWVRSHVITNLRSTPSSFETAPTPWDQSRIAEAPHVELLGYSRLDIAHLLGFWFESFQQPLELWSDVLAYDWVLLRSLWEERGAASFPSCVYYIPFDLATLLRARGVDPDINREAFADLAIHADARKHDALWDAKVIRACYQKLNS